MNKNSNTCNYNKDDFSNCYSSDFQSLKIISTNFRGLHSKHESLTCLINSETPQFKAGTETWLNSSIYTREVLPPNCQVFHADREDGYGGSVLFACHNTINCVKLDINTDCEAVSCKVELSDNRTLIVLVIIDLLTGIYNTFKVSVI